MTYFPILVCWVKTGKHQVITSPEKLENGGSFRVIETNIETV